MSDSSMFNSESNNQNSSENKDTTESNQSQSSNSEDSSQSTQPSLQIPDELKDMVGEGKKYKTVEDALRSVPHAQNHIQTMQQELEHLKQEVARRTAAEEIFEKVQQSQSKQSESTNSGTSEATGGEDIEKLVETMLESKLTARQQEEMRKANHGKVVGELTSKFGEKAEEVYTKKAEELGVSVQFMDDVAAKSPQAVLAYFQSTQSKSPAKTTSSINTEGFTSNNQQNERPKQVMFGATTSDLMSAWSAAKPNEN